MTKKCPKTNKIYMKTRRIEVIRPIKQLTILIVVEVEKTGVLSLLRLT